MKACANGQVGSYWASSETFEMLRSHIDMDFDGLQGDIVRTLGGDELTVDPGKFQNDMRAINGRDGRSPAAAPSPHVTKPLGFCHIAFWMRTRTRPPWRAALEVMRSHSAGTTSLLLPPTPAAMRP